MKFLSECLGLTREGEARSKTLGKERNDRTVELSDMVSATGAVAESVPVPEAERVPEAGSGAEP